MLLTYLLTTLLPHLPSTTAAPTSLVDATEPYNCGYVLTLHNSSAYAGLSAYDRCKGIHYDQDTHSYIPAFAYDLYGGCTCKFYPISYACDAGAEEPIYTGPVMAGEGEDEWFVAHKPKFYRCKTV